MIDNAPFTLAEHLAPTFDEIEAIGSRGGQIVGVPTGFADLDALLGGLRPGLVHTVLGASGIGSSTLALNFARTAAIHHELATLILSGEAPANELTMRLLSAEALIPAHSIRSGTMRDEDWTRLARRISGIAGMDQDRDKSKPLFIRAEPSLPWIQVWAQCAQLKNEQGLRLVVIDGADMFAQPTEGESQQAAQARLAADAKRLAVDSDVAVVLTARMNRFAGRRPMLDEAVLSSPYVVDADVVIGLHRPDAWELEHPRAGEADLIVLRNRYGPTATVTVAFQGHYCRFVDMAMPEPPLSGRLRPVPGEGA